MLRSVINLLTSQSRITVGRLASSSSSGSFSRFDNENYSISDSDSEGSSSDETNVNEIKQKILSASLPFVLKHGWSNKSLALGAEKVDLSCMSHGLFPLGGYELVSHFYKNCNTKLEQKMKESLVDVKAKINTNEFIQGAVKYRLGLITPYLSRWPEASALMCHPDNVVDSFQNFTSMIDDIWHYAGDKSSDLDWYSKRVVLGLVYKSAEVCLVADRSEDFRDTWSFLSRRMNDVDKLRQLSEIPANVDSAFRVARNLLALNNLKRK